MSSLVTYVLDGAIATVTMDDGKVNVLSLAMQDELHGALDRAQADGAVVVLTGRDDVFCAGFDLTTLRAGGAPAVDMVCGGLDLAARVLAFPLPVVIACSGHAIAMGLFLLLSGDERIGATGGYQLTANEVAIGLTMPHAATEILRQRLTPAAFSRAVTLAAPFSPADAVQAGILDVVVGAGELHEAARKAAERAANLDLAAHAGSKLRARGAALEAIRAGIALDDAELRARLQAGG